MKIIFLDFDGVLNSRKFFTERRLDFKSSDSLLERHAKDIDPEALKLLKDFVEEHPDIRIVISSTWRLGTPLEDLRYLFKVNGWPNAPIISKTPVGKSFNDKRGLEIEEWLRTHRGFVEKFVIIDDDSDMTDEQKENHFVQTNFLNGLTEDHIEQMKKILQV